MFHRSTFRILRHLGCAALAAFGLGSSLQAQARGGIQAVVFPNWHASSVSNLVAAVNQAAPRAFELAQAPFFGGSNRWNNTVQFLHGVNRSRTEITATMFLSFHTDQARYDLASRARDLNRFLLTPHARLDNATPISTVHRLVLSPQLEDGWDDATWRERMRVVLDAMDETRILASGKLALRRSIMHQPTGISTLRYRRSGREYEFPVRVERHGVGSTPSSGNWSNDGDFVYKELTINGVRETRNSMVQPSNPHLRRIPLADYYSRARRAGIPTTLWRPAYNIWRREVVNQEVRWIRDSRLPPAWQRQDRGTAFDEREKRVLIEFLVRLR